MTFSVEWLLFYFTVISFIAKDPNSWCVIKLTINKTITKHPSFNVF